MEHSGVQVLGSGLSLLWPQEENSKEGGKKIGITDHRWSWWRETEGEAEKAKAEGKQASKGVSAEAKMKALHLADKHRGKMAKSVDNYYTHIFKPMFCI